MRARQIAIVVGLLIGSCAATHYFTKRRTMQDTFHMTLEEAIRLLGTKELSPNDRKLLTAALGRRGHEVIEHLKAMTRDPDPKVSFEAKNRLSQLHEASRDR